MCKLRYYLSAFIIVLGWVGMAQAQDTVSAAASCQDLLVTHTPISLMTCGSTQTVIYTITNNVSSHAIDFSYNLFDDDSFGSVVITGTTCPTSSSDPSMKTLAPAGSPGDFCTVTLKLQAPTGNNCVGQFNWEFDVFPDTRGCKSINAIDPIVVTIPNPPPPSPGCGSSSPDDLLGDASDFIVLGKTGIVNQNTGGPSQPDTSLCNGNVGCSDTGCIIDNLTDANYSTDAACTHGQVLFTDAMNHIGGDDKSKAAQTCACNLVDSFVKAAQGNCVNLSGNLGDQAGSASFTASSTSEFNYFCLSNETHLKGKFTLNGDPSLDSKFVFLIDGNFNVLKGEPKNGNTEVILNNVDATDLYWVVLDKHSMDENADPKNISMLQGNVIVDGSTNADSIHINNSGDVDQGRLISCNGGIKLDAATISGPVPPAL